jgi:serine/threonine protein kinase/tetratricopeptide (TPR) repeat protein
MAEVFPRRFGKYVLLKSLARGGMGEIYVAATGETGFQKFCVIKKVIAARGDGGKTNRFLDEAKVVLRLAHANLVPSFDAGESDGEFYIAMELVEGKDLREVWNRCVRTRTRIPLDVALHIARETARALAYVHSYGDLKLVHRDVAPPNILLSYFGEVKLTDFGLARSILKQEHTVPGVVFGRAAYLAPEQGRGEVADARSDIYSLGVVIWELLTGHQYLQLQNLDGATAMSLVRHPKVQPPSGKAAWITPELDSVVMRALAPAREDRYQTAEEMRLALSDVITRLSPRADAERSAEFLRALVGDEAREEQSERTRLLAESAEVLAAADEHASGVFPAEPPQRRSPPRAMSAAAPAVPEPPRAATTLPAEDSVPMDFQGRVIGGRYRVLRVLGEGGMGTVYAAEHVDIGKGVAVKILHPQYSRQQDLVERFRREARAASRVGHPHIVDVTDFGTTDDGCAFFVMEHLDGIDLADVLSHERRLEPARACQIAIQICRALEAAHAAGVIHRDLKPENIFLVAREGRADFVKVLDFGIARSLDYESSRLTNPGIAMGTPEYMAPEQALGGQADRRSDIYSVGALLYEMLTGQPPHGEGEEAARVHKQEPPRAPRGLRPDLSPDLERVVMRALELDPSRRQQTMGQLAYDLTKTVWGRPRAVAELLGLRAAGARADDSGGVRDSSKVEVVETPAAAFATGAPRLSPPGPISGFQPVASGGPPTSVALAIGAVAPRPAPSRAGRVLGTMGLLAVAAVIALGAYRRLPWAPHEVVAVAPPPVDPRVERVAALTREAENLLAEPLTFARLPVLEDRLARLRRDGGTAQAVVLAARAARTLEEAAARELDAGNIDAGVAHYKIALGLDPNAQGSSQLVTTLRARAQEALVAGRAAEAVRWARTTLGLAEADPDAHILLARALRASHEDNAAAVELAKALESRPDDAALKGELARARRHAAPSGAAAHPRHVAPAAPRAEAPASADVESPSAAALSKDSTAPTVEKPPAADAPAAPPTKPAPAAPRATNQKRPGESAAGEPAPEQ